MNLRRRALLHLTSSTASCLALVTTRPPALPPIIRKPHRSLHIHGQASATTTSLRSRSDKSRGNHDPTVPPDPSDLLSPERQHDETVKLHEWLSFRKRILLITGAGISTESGIPDYRGNEGAYRKGHKPMLHDQFVRSEHSRKRYWARSMVGWREFSASKPNRGHSAIAEMERRRRIGVDFVLEGERKRMSVITQNVDGLHQKSGTRDVCDLHGRTEDLICMECGSIHSRGGFHEELEGLNRDWLREVIPTTVVRDDIRPDGDAHLSSESFEDFCVPSCTKCNSGFLKPNVVFFGDCVPKSRVQECYGALEAADGILCVGTSLEVYSAFRFVKAAAERQMPIAVLNVGVTRAEREGLEITKIEAPIGRTLQSCVEMMDRDEMFKNAI